MRPVSGPLGGPLSRLLSGRISVLGELLGVVEHVAQLEPLFGVLVVIRRKDNLKDAHVIGLIGLRDLMHSSVQAVPCITEGSKDQPNLLGATRDIIRGVVGVNDRQAVIFTESLGYVSDCP